MSQNKSTTSVSNGSGNKDLSCLRCRKKKAKCSKTRPACTRCARSNQPCEYPDAPPNLTDLSQKVLSLYDTLRELEDKFMLQYTAQEQEQTEMARTGEKRRRRQSSSTSSSNPKSPPDDMPSIETLSLLNPIIKRPRRQQQQNEQGEQDQQQQQVATLPPGNWSMSLTSNGLSLHAVARNMIEFSTFAKDFSHQLRNNDPENKLTKSWEWYEEETVEDEDEDPLDEDEYLVKVPVYSLPSLLGHQGNNDNFVHNTNTTATIKSLNDNIYNENDEDDDDTPYKNRIQPILDDIISYLRQTYDVLSMDEYPIHLYHITTLLQQLQPFIPFDQKLTTSSQLQPIQLICTITGYAASIQLLTSYKESSHSTELVEDCINYATMMLIELVFQRQKDMNPLPIVACAALLAWMGKSDMAHLATRALCGSDDWDEDNEQWQLLAASLLYYEVYSTTFSCVRSKRKTHYEIGEAESWLLQSAKRLIQQQPSSSSEESPTPSSYYYASSLGLETELVCLLKQVFALFYDKERNGNGSNNNGNSIRKVDVDDVLKIVRNIEEWEHQLPKWTQWTTSKTDTMTHDNIKDINDNSTCSLSARWSKLKMHIHLIHNIVKILLFRPFSIEPFGHQRQQQQGHCTGHGEGGGQEDDSNELLQTHTRTTFLDLSLAAADRATRCINHLQDKNRKMESTDDEWIQAGYHLTQDVIRRVKDAFPCDDELLITVQEIQSRLVQVESIESSTLSL
ncbi:hypothetical protein BDA99DRAFT_602828 [Phascolomyces articulosus]|uniref:Zn(2)-C6 fungal-type domain-containing protein n=1 Tax=Phascolomyces articulosus TaxID=60185 RepID=A0AAD5K5K6_9FUNG|nr:hypothetical protein BDA99DRAFT_602828 [Phascolomyces articulosus]